MTTQSEEREQIKEIIIGGCIAITISDPVAGTVVNAGKLAEDLLAWHEAHSSRVPTEEEVRKELEAHFGEVYIENQPKLLRRFLALCSPPKQKVCETCGHEIDERPKE